MQTSDFYYDLPQELIAQTPLKNRSDARMMVLNKLTGQWEHSQFKRLPEYLNAGDLLIFNDTKVSPVRIYGHRPEKEEHIEVLLLEEKAPKTWVSLTRPGRKLPVGQKIIFSPELRGTVLDILPEGERVIELAYDGIFYEILDAIGEMPLPPYIHTRLEDKERYQTIYAKYRGSAAAPTAGLHFTQEVLDAVKAKGVQCGFVTLHIGLGTFRPVKVDRVEDHPMHAERYRLTEETAALIRETKERGGRVIAVGTTSARTLESVMKKNGAMMADRGVTDIFIYPGYTFQCIDGILTNFHLPESTLIMMIAAMVGRETILAAYEEAVRESYRFFSLGDCMLIR